MSHHGKQPILIGDAKGFEQAHGICWQQIVGEEYSEQLVRRHIEHAAEADPDDQDSKWLQNRAPTPLPVLGTFVGNRLRDEHSDSRGKNWFDKEIIEQKKAEQENDVVQKGVVRGEDNAGL